MMSLNAVKEFLEKAAQDKELQGEIAVAVKEAEDRIAAVTGVAARHGFQFTPEELSKILESAQGTADSEPTDEELDAVAGGRSAFKRVKYAPGYTPDF
jgi:predicted ribosomally synthesized peptide with nif11-like leader